jgi:hypothetical protein
MNTVRIYVGACELFGLMVICVALVALCGYIVENPIMTSWGSSVQMSIPTSVCMVCLGVSTILLAACIEIAFEKITKGKL